MSKLSKIPEPVVDAPVPTKEFFDNYSCDAMIEMKATLQRFVQSNSPVLIQSLTKELSDDKDEADTTMSLLPNNCRLFKKKGDFVFLLLEIPPHNRSVQFDITSDRRLSALHMGGLAVEAVQRLAFPYIVFLVVATSIGFGNYRLAKLYVSYRTKPLSGSKKDMLYFCNLPNCGQATNDNRVLPADPDLEVVGYLNGDMQLGVCMGGGNDAGGNLVELGNTAVDLFWTAPFNGDLDLYFRETGKRDKRVNNINTWATNTAKNPLFVLDVNWMPAIPVGELVPLVAQSYTSDSVEKVVSKRVNAIAQKVYDQVWRETLQNNMENSRLSILLRTSLEKIMKRFATNLGASLAALPQGKTRQIIRTAVSESLRDAIQ
jgi:hypothetical protein